MVYGMTRALVYARQSQGKQKSITDQIEVGEREVEARGWILVRSLDDGTSASRFARKAREGWAEVRAEVEAGNVDVVVLWSTSRASRELEDWAAFLNVCRRHGVKLHTVEESQTYDPSLARDWKELASDGIHNASESDRRSVDVRRGLGASARSGKPAQGRAPYGYTRVFDQETGKSRFEVNRDTAPVVERIIGDIARGVPLSRLTRDLNDEGVVSSLGKAWARQVVAQVVRNRAYIAQRNWDGEWYPGEWKPLTSAETFWRANRVLDDPGRSAHLVTRPRPGAAAHLLSGIAMCGSCGSTLRANPARGIYMCRATGCCAVNEAEADGFLNLAIVARFRQPDFRESLAALGKVSDRDVQAEKDAAATKRARLDEIRAAVIRGELSTTLGGQAEVELTRAIEHHERRAHELETPSDLREFVEPGVDVPKRWKATPLARKRRVIRRLAEVRLTPMARGGRRPFSPERFGESNWHGDTRTWAQIWEAAK